MTEQINVAQNAKSESPVADTRPVEVLFRGDKARSKLRAFYEDIPDQWDRRDRHIAEPGVFSFNVDGESTLFVLTPGKPRTSESLAVSIRAFSKATQAEAIVIVAEARMASAEDGSKRDAVLVLSETKYGERNISIWPINRTIDGATLGDRSVIADIGPIADTFKSLITDQEDIAEPEYGTWNVKNATWSSLLQQASTRFKALPAKGHERSVRNMFRPSDRFDLLTSEIERSSGRVSKAYFCAKPSGQVLRITVSAEHGKSASLRLTRYASLRKLFKRNAGLRSMFEEHARGAKAYMDRHGAPAKPNSGLTFDC